MITWVKTHPAPGLPILTAQHGDTTFAIYRRLREYHETPRYPLYWLTVDGVQRDKAVSSIDACKAAAERVVGWQRLHVRQRDTMPDVIRQGGNG